jgi:predicted RNase H-like nuclease (RuvC/YqgF family)
MISDEDLQRIVDLSKKKEFTPMDCSELATLFLNFHAIDVVPELLATRRLLADAQKENDTLKANYKTVVEANEKEIDTLQKQLKEANEEIETLNDKLGDARQFDRWEH